MKSIWVWTQQIEDNIKKIFPNINIFRLDNDNIANKTQKSETLQNIKNAQIIIWTKMITTWFDFHDIKTIWVIFIRARASNTKIWHRRKNLFKYKTAFMKSLKTLKW